MQYLKGNVRRAEILFLCPVLPFSKRQPLRDARYLDLTLNALYISSEHTFSRNSLNSRSTTGSALLGRVPNGILGRVGASLKWVIAAEWSARYLRCTSSIARLQPFPKRAYALCTKVYRTRPLVFTRVVNRRGISSLNNVARLHVTG